ncbi:unnamed protein product [Caenorhabditis angaria]|uniref:RPGR-interacting protein 1 first C2 domain-containing protein n=1 Tax=Caenorhabditis angaria TaxID=860376 RepID=A0A9P1MXG5_9PELO|nr:unnamed protein product [Caenorhabditis angaria]
MQIVKLNRLLKIKDEQIRELQKSGATRKPSSSGSLESVESSESNSSRSEASEPPSRRPSDLQKKPAENSSSNSALKKLQEKLRVAENDYSILLEEVTILKSANEKLIQQTLSKNSQEWGIKENLEDKKRILALEEEIRELNLRLKEIRRAQKPVKRGPEAPKELPKPPEKLPEPERAPERAPTSSRRHSESKILQKLYSEVVDVLKTHDVETSGTSAGISNWQKAYAELYQELEKVKNLLMVQYEIDQKHRKEIEMLQMELERCSRAQKEALEAARILVEEKQKRIFTLEEQIRVIAYATQKSVPLELRNSENGSLAQNLALKLIHVKPTPGVTTKFFFSLEFFDFQLETTPIFEPKEQKLDYTAVYEVIVSNLFVHYLYTLLCNRFTATPSYNLISANFKIPYGHWYCRTDGTSGYQALKDQDLLTFLQNSAKISDGFMAEMCPEFQKSNRKIVWGPKRKSDYQALINSIEIMEKSWKTDTCFSFRFRNLRRFVVIRVQGFYLKSESQAIHGIYGEDCA